MNRIIKSAMFFAALAFGASSAMALGSAKTMFDGQYPGNNASCNVCHTGFPGPLTVYGSSYVNAGGNKSGLLAAMTAIEGLDSDGDGASNLEEINARTDVNDATSTPVVADTEAPVITLSGDDPMTVTQNTTFTDPGSSVTDNVDTGLTATVTGAVDVTTVGTYTLTYTATDAAGNTGTTTRTVNVVAVVTVFSISSSSFTDNGAMPAALACVGEGGTNFSPQISWQNLPTGTKSVSIIMEDTSTDPVTVHWGVFELDPNALTTGLAENAATTQDNIHALGHFSNLTSRWFTTAGQNYTGSIGYEGPCPGGAQHNYKITVYALDASFADQSKYFGAANAANPTALTLISASPSSASFEANLAGVNILAQARLVGGFPNVVDAVAPVITIVGGDVTITQNTTYSEQGVSATDNVDGNLTSSIVTTGSVDTAVVGTYTITYTVADSAGNTTVATRSVTVEAAVSSSGGGLSMSPWMMLALLPLLAVRRRK